MNHNIERDTINHAKIGDFPFTPMASSAWRSGAACRWSRD